MPSSSITKSLFGQLVEACKVKDAAVVRKILEERPKLVLCHDKYHRNLLHYAVILVPNEDLPSSNQELEKDEGFKRSTEESQRMSPRKSLTSSASSKLIERQCLECFAYLLEKCSCSYSKQLAKLWHQADLDGLTILHLAVISCNTALVSEILLVERRLQASALLNSEQLDETQDSAATSSLVLRLDKERHSPLHWAVITNNLSSVKLLIEHAGVQLAHQADLNGATPLHYATQTNDYPKYREQLRQMLKNALGANISKNVEDSPDKSTGVREDHPAGSLPNDDEDKRITGRGSSPLSDPRIGGKLSREATTTTSKPLEQQRQLDILIYLCRLPDINLECCDRDSRTPLLWAASSGNKQALQVLASAGAALNCCDSNQLGALHCAASHGFTDCLECLLQLAGGGGGGGNTSQGLLRRQINQPDSLSCTPLFYAVLSGNIDCVELLLEQGAQPDWQDVRGRTAAHFAALKSQLNILRLLEARGANLWLANKQGDLPLHYAIKSGRLQVVCWLLERSPYERAVNAINNIGRAPIHLAVLRNSAQLIEFLLSRGANINQLVKVRDKRAASQLKRSTSNSQSSPTKTSLELDDQSTDTTGACCYETALDIARRLQGSGSARSGSGSSRRCIDLLEAAGAQTAREVLASRQSDSAQHETSGHMNGRALFEQQTVEMASPIGFESNTPPTSTTMGNSSTEPQSELLTLSQPLGAAAAGVVPRAPGRPAPLRSQVPQSDSTNSSALSQSSLTSLRGLPATSAAKSGPATLVKELEVEQQEGATGRKKAHHVDEHLDDPVGPKRGGLKYQNDFMEASIKCKLYNNQSFPPLDGPLEGSAAERKKRGHYNSAGDLQPGNRRAFVDTRTSTGNSKRAKQSRQEIITHVNVFTSPDAHQWAAAQLPKKALSRHAGGLPPSDFCAASSSGSSSEGSSSSSTTSSNATATSDSEAAMSETNFGSEDEARYLPALEELRQRQMIASHGRQQPPPVQQQQHRFAPPSQGHTQHLPVILSAAEEERSTSGDTLVGEATGGQVGAPAAAAPATPIRSMHAHRQQQQRTAGGQGQRAARAHSQQHRNIDYSQVRAKVDSHRNDSGLSSHFGDPAELELGGAAGRRSKSCSTTTSSSVLKMHPDDDGRAPSISPIGRDIKQKASPRHHSRSPRICGNNAPTTQPTRTIYKSRRLSVDSVELATRVEKALWRYKQETKLFGELQNLKRCQIRSGRANEALLVKRLIEQFRNDTRPRHSQNNDGATPMDHLDSYTGPYTYKAYELYLYDQLRKLSQSNEAKLFGARLPHKFTSPSGNNADLQQQQQQQQDELQTERDYLEEDLRAELELQRVINPGQAYTSGMYDDLYESQNQLLAIEPSGALEEIRVKDTETPGGGEQQRIEIQRESIHSLDQVATSDTSGRGELRERDETQNVAGRQLSSASSSRRSSIDVEREKLDQLPLKTSAQIAELADDAKKALEQAQEKTREDEPELEGELRVLAEEQERKSLELEASQLTAAIITDALGNVSRAASRSNSRVGSPVGGRKKKAEEVAENLEDQREAARGELQQQGQDAEESDQKLKDQEDQEEEEVSGEPPDYRSGGSRRRSVVNIGNKVEVIYHNVGIAIEPVAEGNRSDDEDAAAVSASAEQQTPTADETNDDRQEQEADPQTTGGEREDLPPQQQEEETFEVEASETRPDVIDDASEMNTNDGGQEDETKHEQASAHEEAQLGGQGAIRDDDESSTLAGLEELDGRESESPPLVAPEAKIRSEPLKTRGQSLNKSPSVGLRAHPLGVRRASSPPAVAVASKQVATSQSGAPLTKSRDGAGRHASVSEVSPSATFRRPAGLLRRGKSLAQQVDEQDEAAAAEKLESREGGHKKSMDGDAERKVALIRPAPRRFRCRLKRSQLPSGPYVVEIPIGQVKERWCRIKRRERRRLRASGGQARLVQPLFSKDDQPNELQANGQLPPSQLTHAKSQPNLEQQQQQQQMRQGQRQGGGATAALLTTTADCSNFTLIYELNKQRQQSTSTTIAQQLAGEQRRLEREARWCRAKVARIVDVRTLKRTLSLPESLLYSNDLLKRFNILKL